MRNGKVLSFSGALLMLQLSGCSYDYPTLSQQLGWSDRTLPDGSTVTFDNRHIVPLNPSPRTPNTVVKIPNENAQVQTPDDPYSAPAQPMAMNTPAPAPVDMAPAQASVTQPSAPTTFPAPASALPAVNIPAPAPEVNSSSVVNPSK